MSFLAERLLASSPGGSSAFTLAKKRAALALKVNVDAAGETTAKGYELAAEFIAPFVDSADAADALEAQAAIAGYDNAITGMQSRRERQLRSVGDFKRREYDAYFNDSDLDIATFRNAPLLAMNSSETLDQLVLEAVQTIQGEKELGNDTDELESYLEQLTTRADRMRDFANRVQDGTLGEGQFVGNYGYYVDSDPDTGKVRGAAILPVGVVPPGMDDGYQRAPVTTTVNGAILPVYMPVGQNANGEKVMRAGGFSWTSDGKEFFGDAKSRKAFGTDGSFSLDDRNVFPTVDKTMPKGSFVRAVTDVDETGNPSYGVLYYGDDGKKYRVDKETLDNLALDPAFTNKLKGYMPTLSPGQFQSEAKDASDLMHGPASYENMSRPRTVVPTQSFGRPVMSTQPTPAPTAPPAIPTEGELPRTSFFDRKNRQNVPDRAPARGVAGLIESGKRFFRKASV